MFVSNDLINEPRVTRHADALGRAGHVVSVICVKSDRTPSFEKRDHYSVMRVRLYQRKGANVQPQQTSSGRVTLLKHSLAYPLRLLFLYLQLTYQLAKVGRVVNANVYVSADLDTLSAGALCARGCRRLIYDAHELWPDQFVGTAPSPIIATFRIAEFVLLRVVDAVITVNEFISKEMAQRYKIRTPCVILNVPRKESRVPLQSGPRDSKVALYQGAYQEARGLENLIRACEFLRDDVTLVLRGYGPIETELRDIAKRFENCRFDKPVPQSDLVLAASSADIGIVAYVPVHLDNYFASPNKLFEYIQAGLPVVASDLPFLRKIIVGNEIGCLFDPSDPRCIADAINHAAKDENLMVLRANVKRIQDRYSWEEEQKRLFTVIRDVCRDHH